MQLCLHSRKHCIVFIQAHPSVHFFCCLSYSGQQSKQRCSYFPHPSHFLQLIGGDIKGPQNQPGHVICQTYLGAALGPLSMPKLRNLGSVKQASESNAQTTSNGSSVWYSKFWYLSDIKIWARASTADNNASKPIKAAYPGERSMSVTVCLEIREGDPKADTEGDGTYFYALAFNTL